MRSSWKMAAVPASVTIGLLLAACGSSSGGTGATSSSGSEGKSFTAKFAILQNTHTPTADAAEQFASLVSKDTGGTIKVKVYPNSVLGSTTDQLEGTEANTIQFFATPTLDSVVPSVDALELPYLFPNSAVASKVLNGSALQKALWSQFPAKGLREIGVWEVGFSDILTTSKKVTTPSDLNGLRIRVFDPTMATPEYKLVNGDAVNLSSDQVVTALSTHTIDGADDPPSTMVGTGWDPGSKYLAITNMAYVSSPVLVSEKFWQELSPAQQSGVQKAINGTIAGNLTDAASANTAAINKMKSEGIVVSTPNTQSFQSAFAPVDQQFEQQYPSVVQALQSAIKTDS